MAELFREFFWMIFPIGGMSIGVFAIYMAHRSKAKTLEILRIYAEKGVEPPASLVEALRFDPDRHEQHARDRLGFHEQYGPFTRNPVMLWSRFVLLAVLAAGFAGMAVWMQGAPGTETLVFGFYITAFCLAAVAASALVRALLLPRYDGKQ